MAKRKSTSSRRSTSPLDQLPLGPALQGVVKDVQKTSQSVVKEIQKRIPADWNRNLTRLQQRIDRTATQADLQRLGKRVEELTRQVEKLARGAGASAARRVSSTP